MDRAVFLDRDNTLIANDRDLGDPALVRLIDGVPGGLATLRKAGWRLVVVTNQGGVARGRYTEQDVDAVHQRIASLIEQVAGPGTYIERFYYCPFHPEGTVDAYRREHPWRKPSPGMLEQAAADLDIDLSQSWMIGDATRDIQAGRAAGCHTVLINADTRIADAAGADATVKSFADAVQVVLQDEPRPTSAATDEHAARRSSGARSMDSGDAGRPAQRVRQMIEAAPAGAVGTSGGVVPAAMTAVDAPPNPVPTVSPGTADDIAIRGIGPLRRAIGDLTEELRSERQRKAEFTTLKMAAAFGQLFVILLTALALLQLSSFESFGQWMLGAVLMQMVVITVLVLDLKG